MAETPAPVVALEGVTVVYAKHAALSDVTASFPSGAVGLLGPNGAGKSTLIKTLLGFVVPDRGRMQVLGLDFSEHHLAFEIVWKALKLLLDFFDRLFIFPLLTSRERD